MSRSVVNSALVGSVSLFVLAGVVTAQAQGASQGNGAESVTVTGSRIASSNVDAPVPVTAVSSDQLQALSTESIPAGLAKLPVFSPVRGSDSASDGGYQPTGNYMDIYGLGPIRTLVLENGHRVPSTYYDGTVDVNTLPQMLIQRVETVTGGASAVYGSDAVSGVVNFILDKHFEGLKGNIQGGISTYGDAMSFRAGLAGGEDVLDRGHLEWSVEYFNRAFVPTAPRPYGQTPSGNVGNGKPATPLETLLDVRLSNTSFGGLVTNGPFKGQQFAPDGTLVPFNPGTPTSTSNSAIGGDGGYLTGQHVLPALQTAQAFGRFDYNFNDNISAYVQGSYAQSRSYSSENNLVNTPDSNALTIYSGNPYLKPQYQALLTATNTPSFTLSRYSEDFGGLINLHDHTGSLNINAGVQGTIADNYSWEVYYTHGEGRVNQVTHDHVNTERMYAAVDAVTDPRTGNIVCRVSLVAPGAYPGCVPMNILGNGAPSQKAINWVTGETEWTSLNTLDDFGANVTGTLLDDWAGPIKIASGLEYRLQSLVINSSVADNTFNIQDLRVGLNGNTPSPGALNWTKNVTPPMHGANSVYEGDVELDVPLVKDLPLIQSLSVNGAARYTDYSTSGSAETWRVGMIWQPIDDLRFRATRSRDIRAPTLYDLYQSPTQLLSSFVDYLTGASGSITNISGGNPNLVPEVARNTTAGVTYTPSWLANFSTSLDYFHIVIDNGIGNVNGGSTQAEQICINSGGTSPLCDLVVRPYPITNTTPANYPTLKYTINQNVALTYAEGFNFGVNYESELSEISKSLNGILGVHLFWTHEPTLKSQALPNTVIINSAGTSTAPKDRVSLTVDYLLDKFGVDVVQRYYGPIQLTGDPTLVSAYTVAPYWQTDVNFTYDFEAAGQPVTGFLNINNLFNQFGGPCCAFSGNPGMQYPVASFTDRLGRYFTLGVRFKID